MDGITWAAKLWRQMASSSHNPPTTSCPCAQEDLLPKDSHYMGALQAESYRKMTGEHQSPAGREDEDGEASVCTLTLHDQTQAHIHRDLVDEQIQ